MLRAALRIWQEKILLAEICFFLEKLQWQDFHIALCKDLATRRFQ